MTIDTQFDLKQLVWYLYEGKIQKGIVHGIYITKLGSWQHESYDVTCGESVVVKKNEHELFASRELFIESIS